MGEHWPDVSGGIVGYFDIQEPWALGGRLD